MKPRPADAPGASGLPGRGRLPPPAERGATIIPDRVVARIAARAARAAQAQRAALPPGGQGTAPDASATTRGGSARVHLSLDLPYPADIAGVTRRIQGDVAGRVGELTGLPVHEVTVTVRRLLPARDPRRSRVQ
ncbi:Asp23/Gls24 family envelope stress response protein [Streptomyces flaveolus]|uniref:Asp23/Gls24 family envelope stress response protein n=1 Tax=Streptomyces flaveolus TaxID=67297 RepID=UPI003413A060